MRIGRFEKSTIDNLNPVPEEWTANFTKVLNENYAAKAQTDNRFFEVMGHLFDEEFVLIISYIHATDQLASPITLILSHDIQENSKKMAKTLDDAIDLTGQIFDDIFATKEWNDYNQNWTENKFKTSTFYYKLSRENFSLTLQAQQILDGNLEKLNEDDSDTKS